METLELKTTTTEEVIDHHFRAFLHNDIEEVMKDYTEQSEVWTSEGPIRGLDAITSFFSYVFTVLPKHGTQVGVKQRIIKDDWAYISWNAVSPFISIPSGGDTFVVADGKILLQAIVTHIVQR